MKIVVQNNKLVLIMKISEVKKVLEWLKYLITFILGFLSDKIV